MKRILTKEANIGQVLAQDVYGTNDVLLVKKGSALNAEMIYSLIMKNVLYIFVEDEVVKTDNDEDESMIGSYNQRLRKTEEYKKFSKNYQENVDSLKNSINNIVSMNADENDIRSMVEETMAILDGMVSGATVFDMLNNMKKYDDSTYTHCVNVSLICNVFAKWLGMNEEEIELVTTCGLFHDIGKVTIPQEVIKKPGKLTEQEYEVMKTHTTNGYEILKNYPQIAEEVKLAALMHHEKCDGLGYPLGLKGNAINKYAKIVAIADIYDAMTSARVYHGPLCPFKVIKIFEDEGYVKYEPRFIITFLQNVADTYMQNEVLLSDGRRGKIVYINKNMISKPIVDCQGKFVDLSKEANLSIEKIL
ncbi:MAG: HD-GYP domain-containing protein [Lachnospiraceae bacterium]|nr:HD-GYP domain-containing protein [Lachnospiraceae bacterium]